MARRDVQINVDIVVANFRLGLNGGATLFNLITKLNNGDREIMERDSWCMCGVWIQGREIVPPNIIMEPEDDGCSSSLFLKSRAPVFFDSNISFRGIKFTTCVGLQMVCQLLLTSKEWYILSWSIHLDS